MATLYYKKLNDVYIKIASDEQYLLNELHDYFSFYADGYKFAPSYRAHVWDGKINLVNLRTMTTLGGLVPEIAKFCAQRQYQLVNQDEQQYDVVDDLSNFDQWVQSLKLPFQPRDYQLSMVKHAISTQRTLMLSATGCHGKSTRVKMYDGLTKKVEDVVVGDRLGGIDNEPRIVTRTIRGFGPMYQILPDNGDGFTANDEHILPLLNLDNNRIDTIAVDHYVNADDDYKSKHALIKLDSDTKEITTIPFDVIQTSDQVFYGFETTGDHLYVLDNGIVQHNSGKSLAQYMIMRWMIEHDRKVVIIVPSTSLVEQMHSDFKSYAVNDKQFDVDRVVHKLYAKIKTTDPYNDQCVITTWQSIQNYDSSLYQTWDCVIVDECFDGNMRVLTPSGYVPIKDVKKGDKVINFDETTCEFKEDEVVEVYCNMPNSWSEKMYELAFDNGSVIKVTGNHKFLTKNRGWVRADQLTADDDVVEGWSSLDMDAN